MITVIHTPIDELYETHTDEDCWCLPGQYKETLIHRPIDLIDRTGPDGMFITGYARIWPKN